MSETPWMDEARKLIGKGEADATFNKWLSGFWPTVGLPQFHDINGAVHAWCALFVNVMLRGSGYKGNGHADALSFAHYGTPCEDKYGCVCVIEHANGKHHVTFRDHNGYLGGNQSNKVCIQQLGHGDRVIAHRWPVKNY